ncbi:MAG: hypothetical protein ABIP75_06185 [Pyrinomonadaceae bacterium]
MKAINRKLLASFGANALCLSVLSTAVVAQDPPPTPDPQTGSRQIFAEEFTRSRPAPNKPPTQVKPGGEVKPGNRISVVKPPNHYRRTARVKAGVTVTVPTGNTTPPRQTVVATAGLAKVGVTIWRLRAPQNGDQGARLLIQGGAALVPERVASDAMLRVNDQVLLSVESPREGYLYIVDRELFADGTFGEPYLIFPTTRTRGGANRVSPGRLINIPDPTDQPNFFRLAPTPGLTGQVGEALSVIVTSMPLTGFTPSDRPIKLTAAQVAKWEAQWGGDTELYDLENGAGQTQTEAESEAAQTGVKGRMLTQEEPSPQTVYLVESRNTTGLLVNVLLRY